MTPRGALRRTFPKMARRAGQAEAVLPRTPFVLDKRADEADAVVATFGQGRSKNPETRCVLVVEEDIDLRGAFAACLRHEGYEVLLGESGLAALEVARERRPDVIVMDLDLTGMDGWEATRVLKSDPHTRAIPVVAIIGRIRKTRAEDARTAGCNEMLCKPCGERDLIAVVRRLAPL